MASTVIPHAAGGIVLLPIREDSMPDKDEISEVLRRLSGREQADDKFEFAKIVRRLIIDRKIPLDHAYEAVTFAVAQGHNFEIYTGNRWFDEAFRHCLEYYATAGNRFDGIPARAGLLAEYKVLTLVPAVRDDLIASHSAIEAILPLNALMDIADSGESASQDALIIAGSSPMTEEYVREFINDEINRKVWYKARCERPEQI
jgi:hypothetical protein